MRILIAIPFLFGAEHSKLCIESVINSECDLLLIDNGAEQSVKNVLNFYHSRSNVHIISNQENIFVNPAWNQAMEFFLSLDYDRLIIMNSDLIMHPNWFEVLKNRLVEFPDEITLPIIADNILQYATCEYQSGMEVASGTPGVFISLNKKQVEIVYPIHSEIKIWFGDNWILDSLRGLGFKTVIAPNLFAYHYYNGSQSVSKLNGISEMIEQDKKNWTNIVQNKMFQLIQETEFIQRGFSR